MCYESYYIEAPNNISWRWIDSTSTIYVANNNMQGFLNLRKLIRSEQIIYSEHWIGSHMEALGTYRFI